MFRCLNKKHSKHSRTHQWVMRTNSIFLVLYPEKNTAYNNFINELDTNFGKTGFFIFPELLPFLNNFSKFQSTCNYFPLAIGLHQISWQIKPYHGTKLIDKFAYNKKQWTIQRKLGKTKNTNVMLAKGFSKFRTIKITNVNLVENNFL